MRKLSILLSIIVLASMILAACGGEEAPTNLPSTSVPPITADVTQTNSAGSATQAESSTPAGVSTETTITGTPGTPGIPVTGAVNSDRLSNELKFKVLDQSGKQVGKVADIVLDLSKAKVLYVVVSAEKQIPVPWAMLKVGTDSTNSNTNGQPNAFILQTDTETFKKAPELNLKNVPQLGQSPDSWDVSFRKYWAGGGAISGSNSTNTPSPAGTAATDVTATATSASSATSNVTSTPAASAGTTQEAAIGQGATTIQGVQLASQVLGAKVTVGTQALSPGMSTPGGSGTSTTATTSPGTGVATATQSADGSATTSTPSSAGTSAATATSSTGASQTTSTPSANATAANLNVTINDMIVNNDAGEILYIVIKTSFDDGEHLIPVPLRLLQLISSGPASDTGEPTNQSFVLNTDATALQNAPFFTSDQFPDMTMPGWNSQFDSFWQQNGSGQGTAAQATATP